MAASSLPIPAPPRTPSPLSDDIDDDNDNKALHSPTHGSYDAGPSVLTHSPGGSLGSIPESESVQLSPTSRRAAAAAASAFRDRNGSATSLLSIPSVSGGVGIGPGNALGLSPRLAELAGASPSLGSSGHRNPFDFQTTTYIAGAPAAKSSMGQRRGHKYKHSSVSHQIFLEPSPKAPLRLPASLPIPTLKEGWASMSREQTIRVGWCCCHLFVAAYVQWTAQGSLALTALSHLIFYDAIGAFLCAGVEILSNFEVWKRPTIRQPFGLERSEVLVGFAMSILLLFMGFDLISHNVGHALEDVGNHAPHREHKHTRVSPGSVDLASLLAIGSTLISAVMLQNHERTAKALRFGRSPLLSFLPAVLKNPSHLLTLSCSGLLLLMPMLSHDVYTWMDRALSTLMALCMCIFGVQLVISLGSMLLMSYSPPSLTETSACSSSSSATTSADTDSTSNATASATNTVSAVLQDIQTDPAVVAIDEAKFWQVHYGLCMANLKIRVRRTTDESLLLRLRERVGNLIKNKLGGGYGVGGGVNWEVSLQISLDR